MLFAYSTVNACTPRRNTRFIKMQKTCATQNPNPLCSLVSLLRCPLARLIDIRFRGTMNSRVIKYEPSCFLHHSVSMVQLPRAVTLLKVVLVSRDLHSVTSEREALLSMCIASLSDLMSESLSECHKHLWFRPTLQ